MPAASTFESHFVEGPGCWEWVGNQNPAGYGVYRTQLAHRLAWEAAYGPIPTGLAVLHACDNPSCVRPSHLMVGTWHANAVDASRKGMLAKQRNTHCVRGHELTPDNVYLHPQKGTQNCRTCKRAAQLRADARRERKGKRETCVAGHNRWQDRAGGRRYCLECARLRQQERRLAAG